MISLLTVAFTLALSLTAVTASTHNVDNVLESRQSRSGNSFHISNSYVGCGLPGFETCSFEMTIDSEETFDLPGINSHCYFRVPEGDNVYHQCDLLGATSSMIPGRQVLGVWALVSLDTNTRNPSSVHIAVQFTNPRNGGSSETWVGVEQGDYDLFSIGLSSYDIIPVLS